MGMIISPYSPQNTSVIADIRCLTIGDDVAREFLCSKYIIRSQFKTVLLVMRPSVALCYSVFLTFYSMDELSAFVVIMVRNRGVWA